MPGYTDKVEFGVLVSFAYPVEGSGTKILHYLTSMCCSDASYFVL